MATKKKDEMLLGKKQAEDIIEIYRTKFNAVQREAFLLGRISALLDFGNAISTSANETIADSEAALRMVRAEIQNPTPKKTRTKAASKKKEVNKDE